MLKIIEPREKNVLRLFFCLVLMIINASIFVGAENIGEFTLLGGIEVYLGLTEEDIIAGIDADKNEIYTDCKGNLGNFGEEYGNIKEYIEPLSIQFDLDIRYVSGLNGWEIFDFSTDTGAATPTASNAFQVQDPDDESEYFPKTLPVTRYQLVKEVSSEFTSYDFENTVEIVTSDNELDIRYFPSIKQKCGGDKSLVYLVYHIDLYPLSSLCTLCTIPPYCSGTYLYPGTELLTSFWSISLLKYTLFLINKPYGHKAETRALIKQGAISAMVPPPGKKAPILVGQECLDVYKILYEHNLRCES